MRASKVHAKVSMVTLSPPPPPKIFILGAFMAIFSFNNDDFYQVALVEFHNIHLTILIEQL